MKRFWDKVDVKGPDDCWEWQASQFRAGYGQFKFDGRNQQAHRVAYLLETGEIPEGMAVAHLCHNKRCCNPAHLEAQTYQENQRANFTRLNRSKAQKWSEEQIAEMLRLRGEGLVPRQIAKAVGAPLKTVERYVYSYYDTSWRAVS